MHAVSFNVVSAAVRDSYGSNCGAFNASQGASATDFVLLGGENHSFFSLAAASSTDVHRVKQKKDLFVLLGGRDISIFIGRRPD